MDIDQPLASGSMPKRSNMIFIPDGNTFAAVPQAPLTSRPSGEAVVCIDNGSASWRAGFAGASEPYINKANLIARYKERKVGKNIMLFGKEVDADSNSRSSIRSMFDGDMLIHSEILECALDYTFLTLGFDGSSVDTPVVMTERLANPLFTRAMTSEMLFELYGAPSVTYGVDSLFAFSRQKHQDGLAISMGHNSTTVIPVADGKGVLSRAKRIPWGGSQADELMLKLAQLKYPGFPVKVTASQSTFMTRETCYFATDYEAELRDMASSAGLAAATMVVQFPYTAQEVIEKSEAELAAQAEKRKEQGKRLQEMQIKMRADKLAEQIAQLEQYKNLLAQRTEMDPDEWIQELYSTTDFDSPTELEAWVKKTEGNIKRKQKKDAGEEEVEEDPVFPLVDRPDEELTEEEIKEKRKQRLMKAGWEARVKIREEKQREKERVEEEKRKEEEERMTDPEGWAKKLRLQHEAVIARMEMRKKQKTQRKDRKSAASQSRMKTIANLAAEEKVSKKRKKGDDDDGFGRDDEDWAVYREVGGDDESDAEEDDENALSNIETQLLQYDSTFTEDDTLSGRAHAKNALINAFVRGGNKERFNPDDLRQTYQLHLNVERIRVPETWFQPSMFGHDSAGLGEIAGWVLGGYEEEQRKRMMQCIFVTGGSSLIPNLIPRLRNTLTPMLPFRAPLKIVSALDGGDPRLEAWKGMAQWSVTEEAKQARVTRQEYEERGGEWLKEHAWGNPCAQTDLAHGYA